MKKVKKVSVILATVLALTAVLSACGTEKTVDTAAKASNAPQASEAPAKPKDKVKMKEFDWLEPENKGINIQKDLLAEFNARTDVNATFDVSHLPSTPFYPKLNAQIAGNEAPDVFTLHAAGKMKTYADSGKILPLNEFLDKDQAWKDSFISGAFNLLTFHDKIYGVPVNFAAATMYYNKDIFKQYNLAVPKTYDELKNVIDVLVKNKVTPIAMGAKDAWVSALFSEFVANRIGGDAPFNALMDGKGTWLDPSYIETGRVLQELTKMKAFPEGFLSIDNSAMTTMFQNGQAAMMVTGSWAINTLVNMDSKVKDSVGIAKFPTFPNGKGDIDTWLGQPAFNLVISSTAKDKDAAVKYLKAWSEEKIQKRVGEEQGDIPAIKVTLDPAKVPALSKDLKDQMSTMKGMFIFYDVGLGAKIGDEYNNTIQAILAGKAPEEAFKSLQAYTEKNR
ncbi:sugar ABC transporter substrate-binding protein [Paenibacillus alba]|uniref:ABC transporter substrate-binding protein n=1 Tax=Paenibacillus alba TaxID=1197127 RepID=UPI001563EA06|nr:sugar ABC transporter substrate-binding protein [Paenibacillus alba]NQX68993.1 sugar ABC transporter substrate-binding protein [Paenibacillus alba]